MLWRLFNEVHLHFYFAGVALLTLPILVKTSLIDIFVQEILLMDRVIVPIRALPVSIISEYRLLSDPLAVFKTFGMDD